MSNRGSLRAGLGLLVAACQSAPINPATDGDRTPRRLGTPAGEFPAPFGTIRAVMALPDGRLVVSDPQENRVVLIDFPQGTSTLLSRVGEGPREFGRPGGLYRGSASRILVFDQALMRLLPVAPTGAVENVVGLPTGGIAGDWSARGPDPLAVDSLGQTYLSVRRGFTARTTVVLRYRPGTRPDTVATLLTRQTKALQANRNGTGSYQDVLFSPEDAWTVAPDGWIAVARAAPYHVEWIPPHGPPVIGPAIHCNPIPIPRAEKELIASGAGGSRGLTSVALVLVRPGGAPPPSDRPSSVPVGELLFAKAKTPVNLRDGRWPILDEGGRLWVERSLPAGVTTPVFDVFDRRGELVDRIEFPAGSRLVGFDRQWIYAARIDADDLQYLQRFALLHSTALQP